MRETRTYGSAGGGWQQPFLPQTWLMKRLPANLLRNMIFLISSMTLLFPSPKRWQS
jgi:hypothetical protein